jgi:hypothetical protein
VAMPAGAMAARALFDEGDDPGLTDRVGPPVSEREATTELEKRSRPVVKISKEMTCAIKVDWVKLTIGCGKFFSKFSNKYLGFKIKDFKFQTKIELGQNRINSNKLFEYFSSRQFLKISLE